MLSAVLLSAVLSPFLTSAQTLSIPNNLVGTWSTKSNQTLTGPGFYDPLNERLIEPSHTGISYSFTSDGYFEAAYYRAVANPKNPQCPSAIMQWQHGSFQYNANGSLILTPIAVDGRQLLSSPCEYDTSIYTRYNQSELFQSYQQYTDTYHNIPRLDLFKFDGSPMNPMYLAFSPPQMLPTTTLNPTNTASGSAAAASKTGGSKNKRSLDREVPVNWKGVVDGKDVVHTIDADRLWWIGVGLVGVGGILYFGPRRLGIQI